MIQLNRTHATALAGRCSPAAKAGFVIAVALSSLSTVVPAALALSEDELYTFCSQYPYNTQCEGYEIPIPLSSRTGEEGICALNMPGTALTDRCKVLSGEESLTVYVEQGEAIAPLDGERRTAEFSIDLNSITALTYREDESVNRERLVANTFLFGILGAVLTQPDKISQMNIQFGNELSTDADTAVLAEPEQPAAVPDEEPIVPVEETVTEPDTATVAEPSSSSNLVFETGREQGRSMGESLQQSTGVPLNTSL